MTMRKTSCYREVLKMKNIQIIEGSKNSVFEIYEVSNNIFAKVFPNGTDVAFLEDVEHVLTVLE